MLEIIITTRFGPQEKMMGKLTEFASVPSDDPSHSHPLINLVGNCILTFSVDNFLNINNFDDSREEERGSGKKPRKIPPSQT